MKRISKYIPGCDGTRLAVDVYLPDCEARVPVLLFGTGSRWATSPATRRRLPKR